MPAGQPPIPLHETRDGFPRRLSPLPGDWEQPLFLSNSKTLAGAPDDSESGVIQQAASPTSRQEARGGGLRLGKWNEPAVTLRALPEPSPSPPRSGGQRNPPAFGGSRNQEPLAGLQSLDLSPKRANITRLGLQFQYAAVHVHAELMKQRQHPRTDYRTRRNASVWGDTLSGWTIFANLIAKRDDLVQWLMNVTADLCGGGL